MVNANKVDALVHFATIQRSQFDIRQKLEWRVIFSAFTFYLVSVYGVYTLPNFISPLDYNWIGYAYFIFTIILFLFLLFIHRGHVINKKAAEWSEHAFMELAGFGRSRLLFSSTWLDNAVNWPWRGTGIFILEILFIGFFSILSWLLVTAKITDVKITGPRKVVSLRETDINMNSLARVLLEDGVVSTTEDHNNIQKIELETNGERIIITLK